MIQGSVTRIPRDCISIWYWACSSIQILRNPPIIVHMLFPRIWDTFKKKNVSRVTGKSSQVPEYPLCLFLKSQYKQEKRERDDLSVFFMTFFLKSVTCGGCIPVVNCECLLASRL